MDDLNTSPQLETHPYNSLDIPSNTTLLIVGTAPPQRFSCPRPPFAGPKKGLDADFFYGSESNYLWTYLKLAANEPDFAKPGTTEAEGENTEAIMKEYLLRHRMWMHDVLQTYIRKEGRQITARDADIDLNHSRTTFMDFPAVLEAGKKIERVVFTSVQSADWFFGKVLASCFHKEMAESYRRLFLHADARRRTKKDTDEQYTDEFCKAEFSARIVRFHIAPSPSGSAGASGKKWFSDIYRKILFSMSKSKSRRLMFSFQQANSLCRGLVQVGDKVPGCWAQLREVGFCAFVPRQKFIESFAETPAELELHRQCVVERAREQLGQPTPIRIYDEDLKNLYFSPFLQRLREQRDRDNGYTAGVLRNRYKGAESVWREEVDPCQRRIWQERSTNSKAHEMRFSSMIECERRALKEEAEQSATGLGKSYDYFDGKARYDFFSAVMSRDAPALGFHYDKAKSRPKYPVFSKPMNDDWHLCWAIENARSFFPNPFEGRLELCLELRSSQIGGSLATAEPGEFLLLRYTAIGQEFLGGYSAFYDLDQLERIVKARLHLYSLMAPDIERPIKQGLIEFLL